MRKSSGMILLVVLLAACSAGRPSEAAVAVSDAWARPAGAGENSAVYFSIENRGPTGDMLLSADAEVAQLVQLHRSMSDEGGVMSMEEQEEVAVLAGEAVIFEPGGLHVMLMGLEDGLAAGESFPLKLQFETAGEVEIRVEVRDQ